MQKALAEVQLMEDDKKWGYAGSVQGPAVQSAREAVTEKENEIAAVEERIKETLRPAPDVPQSLPDSRTSELLLSFSLTKLIAGIPFVSCCF